MSSDLKLIAPIAIDAYWCRIANFGDLLTELICDHYGLRATYAIPYYAQLIGVGSILDRIPSDFAGYVLGSGFGRQQSFRPLRAARILAARGPLTWERLGRPTDCVLGDPGLLARHLLSDEPAKKYHLGLLPHYADRDLPQLAQLAAQHPDDVLFIDATRPALEVFHNIAQCEGVFSSSLHGLIVADAFQIPSAWKACEQVLGGGFKFADHFAAVDSPRQAVEFRDHWKLNDLLAQLTPPPPRAVAIADELHELCRELPTILSVDERRAARPWLRFAMGKVKRALRLDVA
jgi:pyruvyltransferase